MFCFDAPTELFDLILSDKITVFDLDYDFRVEFSDMYIAEFRKSRYFPDRHRETLKRMKEDINRLDDPESKARLIRLYKDYEEPIIWPDETNFYGGIAMSERLEALRASAAKDEKKIQELQDRLKAKREKIKEQENAEIMSSLNSLSAKGLKVDKIISAIGNRDYPSLMQLLMKDESPSEESGTIAGSAFLIQKQEDTENE